MRWEVPLTISDTLLVPAEDFKIKLLLLKHYFHHCNSHYRALAQYKGWIKDIQGTGVSEEITV